METADRSLGERVIEIKSRALSEARAALMVAWSGFGGSTGKEFENAFIATDQLCKVIKAELTVACLGNGNLDEIAQLTLAGNLRTRDEVVAATAWVGSASQHYSSQAGSDSALAAQEAKRRQQALQTAMSEVEALSVAGRL